MLIDDLEQAGERIAQAHQRLHQLDLQYRQSYDRDIRSEMDAVRKIIRREKARVREELYHQLQELSLIQRHFPDLFQVLQEYDEIGSVIGQMKWLVEFRPAPKTSPAELEKLRKQRRLMAKAREFLQSWAGPIDARSLEATWPLLRGKLKASMDRDEALQVVDETEQALRRQGWRLLINEPYIQTILARFLRQYQKARSQEIQAKTAQESARGRGSVAEYDAAEAYRSATRARAHWERYIRHLLLSNHAFLGRLQRERITWKDASMSTMARALVLGIAPRTVNEVTWLSQMRQRLGEAGEHH